MTLSSMKPNENNRVRETSRLIEARFITVFFSSCQASNIIFSTETITIYPLACGHMIYSWQILKIRKSESSPVNNLHAYMFSTSCVFSFWEDYVLGNGARLRIFKCKSKFCQLSRCFSLSNSWHASRRKRCISGAIYLFLTRVCSTFEYKHVQNSDSAHNLRTLRTFL